MLTSWVILKCRSQLSFFFATRAEKMQHFCPYVSLSLLTVSVLSYCRKSFTYVFILSSSLFTRMRKMRKKHLCPRFCLYQVYAYCCDSNINIRRKRLPSIYVQALKLKPSWSNAELIKRPIAETAGSGIPRNCHFVKRKQNMASVYNVQYIVCQGRIWNFGTEVNCVPESLGTGNPLAKL